MFEYRCARPFDTIVGWDALVNVVATGRQREYVEMIDANLTAGGTAIMTGVARADGRPGRDLEILDQEFASEGYVTALTEASPPSDRWARGYLPQPVFPVLMALKLR
jgi:hypothetical protein